LTYGVYHVVVAVNTTVEVGRGVFGCDEQQVLRVVVDVVEQLSPVVAAAVGADVDVLHQEVVLVVAFLARVVHLMLGVVVDTVEVLDRIVVVVVEAAVDGLLGEVASRSQLRPGSDGRVAESTSFPCRCGCFSAVVSAGGS
jgi:hypothetical protein